ncbi:AraC family transcriptional regulator [Saccharopolyspora sp. NPDC050642]|uniref:AraC family transcriptional regulator n=1 Tax=Saccharopolyspora sp. NPDC050642 TaxID=3157099 RepID=UPI0033E3CD33
MIGSDAFAFVYVERVDALADVLRAVRADGAVIRQNIASPPWSWLNDEPAPLTLYAVLRGEVWVVPDGGEAAPLRAGDTAIVRGPRPHGIADSPDTPPQVRIHHARHCTSTSDGATLAEEDSPRLGPRTYGSLAEAPVALVTGAYRLAGDIGQRLLDALPPLIVVPASAGGPSSAVALLAEELDVDQPGQQLVLDRLLDLLLVRTLRAWFASPGAEPPAWYRALADPVVGAALRAMHGDPGHAWTVASLAAAADVSRAAFARRFAELVGEPPLSYLTSWRMALAADLLREPGATVASVARKVGYQNDFAFSTAFKRVRGASPSQVRARER